MGKCPTTPQPLTPGGEPPTSPLPGAPCPVPLPQGLPGGPHRVLRPLPEVLESPCPMPWPTRSPGKPRRVAQLLLPEPLGDPDPTPQRPLPEPPGDPGPVPRLPPPEWPGEPRGVSPPPLNGDPGPTPRPPVQPGEPYYVLWPEQPGDPCPTPPLLLPEGLCRTFLPPLLWPGDHCPLPWLPLPQRPGEPRGVPGLPPPGPSGDSCREPQPPPLAAPGEPLDVFQQPGVCPPANAPLQTPRDLTADRRSLQPPRDASPVPLRSPTTPLAPQEPQPLRDDSLVLLRAEIQQPRSAEAEEGEKLTLSCNHPNVSTEKILWYRHVPSQAPRLLAGGFRGETPGTEAGGTLYIAQDKASSVFEFRRVRLADAAVYYCALSDTT
ncbi:T cell receptor alpha variable 4 [Platysternon megacephalum]|nr:T cell receptor alpha variable 4 [Platysternon megacephalum]